MTGIDPDARDAVEDMLDEEDEAFEHLRDVMDERQPMGLHREGVTFEDE